MKPILAAALALVVYASAFGKESTSTARLQQLRTPLMGEKTLISASDAPKPIGPYSQGVVSSGLMFASGQIPIDPKTNELLPGDIETQTEQVIKNLLAVLKEAKMGPENVVKTTVYLVDLADFPRMNTVYGHFFGKQPPARSTIQAVALPRGARVEIDMIAAY
ncbi:MAG TPA: RidA family protein [Vicinamibacteria bacterium]|jgi:2-iminobutanoate/2-iminopropanoate deaminase|nr:RidA family protein [Vicinamibacteria bacterium]